MSKQGPTATGSTTTTTTLPAWYQQQLQSVFGEGNSLYNGLPFLVPGMTPDQMSADFLTNATAQQYMTRPQIPAYDVFGMGNQWDTGAPTAAQAAAPTMANIGGVNLSGLNNAAQATAQQAAAAQAQAAQLKPGDIAQFMNPYIDTALNPVLSRLRTQQGEVQSGIGAKAAAAHMFGGSREAVERMLADRNYRDTLANTAGNMLNTGWNTAAGLESQNVDRSQQTNLANAQFQNAINSLNAQLGTQVSLGNAQMQNAMQTAQAQIGMQGAQIGMQGNIANAQLGTQTALQNAQMQNALNSQYSSQQFQGAQADAARFLQAIGLQSQVDSTNLQGNLNLTNALNQLGTQQQGTIASSLQAYWNQLNQLANLMKGVNPGSTSTGTTTQSQTKPFDFGSLVTGGIGLAGLLSDRNSKTDIEYLGVDPQTGFKMYAYRYKNDPKSYPKVIGPMAQDLEETHPHLVRKIGEHLVILNG